MFASDSRNNPTDRAGSRELKTKIVMECTIWGIKKEKRHEYHYAAFDGFVKDENEAIKMANNIKADGFLFNEIKIMPEKVCVILYLSRGIYPNIPPILEKKIIL